MVGKFRFFWRITMFMLGGLAGCGAEGEAPLVLDYGGSAANAKLAASRLAGKMIVGYQGWFGCPGDFRDNAQWIHWFDGSADPANLTVDALPYLGQLETADLCDSGLKKKDGSPIHLFSSQNAKVVDLHFSWMKDYAIDAAAFQNFVSLLNDPIMKSRRDNVLTNVNRAALAHDRFFYITYDVTGADPATVMQTLRDDWRYLNQKLKITESAAYLRDGGKPVLQLWGFGFRDHPGEPAEVAALIAALKNGEGEVPAVTLIGGVPAQWRTLSGGSRSESGWSDVYRSYDVLSPWQVGEYASNEDFKWQLRDRIPNDLAQTKAWGVGYQPVVFPGFSWFNLMSNRGFTDRAIKNEIPRQCGNFLWRQLDELKKLGVTNVFGAMFDEVDEATALFPTQPKSAPYPEVLNMVFLDADGCDLPADWSLQILQKASAYLKNGPIPLPDLAAAMQEVVVP